MPYQTRLVRALLLEWLTRAANRVKIVRSGTLEPAQADGPKLDDSCDGRDGVWRNEGAGQEDEGRSVFGSMTEMKLGYCLRHLSTSVFVVQWERSSTFAMRVSGRFRDFQNDTRNAFLKRCSRRAVDKPPGNRMRTSIS